MSTQDHSLLTNPHPCRHIVYPYNDAAKAINAVCLFAISGIEKGESVILFVADSRRDQIIGRLTIEGLDVTTLQDSGQLQFVSAEEMLRTAVPAGDLDDAIFKEVVTRFIHQARAASPGRTVRVFGEIVSLLLAQNEVATAERMEELWNELIKAHSVSLFCTYALVDGGYATLPETIAKLHTNILCTWVPEINAPHTIRATRRS